MIIQMDIDILCFYLIKSLIDFQSMARMDELEPLWKWPSENVKSDRRTGRHRHISTGHPSNYSNSMAFYKLVLCFFLSVRARVFVWEKGKPRQHQQQQQLPLEYLMKPSRLLMHSGKLYLSKQLPNHYLIRRLNEQFRRAGIYLEWNFGKMLHLADKRNERNDTRRQPLARQAIGQIL